MEVLAPHARGLRRHETLAGIPVTRFRYAWPASQQTICYRGGALFNLRRAPANWLKLPALVICEGLALWRLVRARPCDVIHAHWVLPQGLIALFIGRLWAIPVVITVHGSDVFALRGRPWTWLKRFALRRVAAVAVNSAATEAAVRAIAPGLRDVRRIPMGVAELRVAVPQMPRNGPILVFVGRLVAQKGVADLLQGLAILSDDWPMARAVIVGEGPEQGALETRAKELAIEDRVRFVGAVDPVCVPRYLAEADVFVAPSTGPEGQGLAIIEAMLAGTPVVASRSGGVVDAIRDGETGLLVDEGAPAQIATAVARLLRDRGLAERLAARARATAAETYATDRAADAYVRLFTDVLARTPKRATP